MGNHKIYNCGCSFLYYYRYLYRKNNKQNKTIKNMSKYLKLFETTAAYNAAKDNLILPNVSLITENNKVEYNPSSPTPIGTNLSYRLSEDDNNYYIVWGKGEHKGKLLITRIDIGEDTDTQFKYNPSNGICTLVTDDDLPEDTYAWGGQATDDYGYEAKGQPFTRTVNGETYTFTPVSGNDEQWTISPEINQYD